MTTMSQPVMVGEPSRHRVSEAIMLFLAVVVLAMWAVKFRSHIHVWGGAWMLLSAVSLTYAGISRLRRSATLEVFLAITACNLAITVGWVLAGR
ncbi:MAG: hypothetical protein ACRD4X_11765 [Candidatus Acidiferrales bacterium]